MLLGVTDSKSGTKPILFKRGVPVTLPAIQT
jgi:hypothetical protein